MFLEPCCYHKHLEQAVRAALHGQLVPLVSFGDVTVMHLLDYLLRKASGSTALLVLPRLRPALIQCLEILMDEKLPSGKWLIGELTLISCGCEHTQVVNRLGRFRNDGRLTICEDKVATRVLALSNGEFSFTVTGPLNQDVEYQLHIWQLSASQEVYNGFSELFSFQKKRKSLKTI